LVLVTRDKFIKSDLEVVKEDYKKLVKDKDKAAEAMQSNVFHNYPKFITTSKEIGSISHSMNATLY
jgi:hypothetical protein